MNGVRGRLLGGIAAAALALAAAPMSAPAAISADPVVTILYVKGDADANQIQVDCRSKIVTVNGAPAADGHASCADLKKLSVFGFGGDDTIRLTGFPVPVGESGGGFFGDYEEEEEATITVNGGDGNDDLAGDALGETLNGGAGNDVLSAGPAFALLLGGPGSDRLRGSLFSFLLGGKGADRLDGGTGFSFSFGQAGPDVLAGGGGPDLAGGGKGRDKLVGNGGGDFLFGEAGNDTVFGGSGRDLLVGGAGRDSLRGGPGRDREFQDELPRGQAGDAFDSLGGGGASLEIAVVGTRLVRQLLR